MSLHGHDPNKEVGHGGSRSYIIGLTLSVILTVIAFGSVTQNWVTPFAAIFVIAGAALMQVVVHVVFFLHMSRKSTPFWNATIFFFMLLVVALLMTGTLFIMFTATHNMMPAMQME